MIPFIKEGVYYKIEAQGVDEMIKKTIFCVYLEAQLQSV